MANVLNILRTLSKAIYFCTLSVQYGSMDEKIRLPQKKKKKKEESDLILLR